MAEEERTWFQFLDVFTSIDEKLDVMTSLLQALVEKPAITPTTRPAIVERPPQIIKKVIRERGRERTEEFTLAEAVVDLSNTLRTTLDFLQEEFASHDNYLKRETSVKKGKTKNYNLVSLIGRPARCGHLISDDGEIEFDINGQKDFITLKNGEEYVFDEKKHKIEKIKIQTDSTTELNFRLLLV